jgi:hypothetical protein
VELVSDNGTSFTSYEFREFLRVNGIKHTLIPPYHPSSNGQAERYVQTVKSCLKKLDPEDITLSLSRFLLENHSTPHAGTGKAPAELMMGRPLRTALHLVLPANPKMSNPLHKYRLNDLVYVKNFGRGEKWVLGKVIKLLGSKWVLCDCDGMTYKRHVNQLRHKRYNGREIENNEELTCENVKNRDVELNSDQSQNSGDTESNNDVNKNCNSNTESENNVNENGNSGIESENKVSNNDVMKETIRRSTRKKNPVVRLNYEGRGVISPNC